MASGASAIRLFFNCAHHTHLRPVPLGFISIRRFRYDKKGGVLPGRIRYGWRNVDHNPANIPSAWIPDSWKEENNINYEREKELAKYIPGYEAKIQDHEHPDYHPEPQYQLSTHTKLVEGLRQALNLSKCVLIEEMPKQIQDLSKEVAIMNQDERVIQVFRHALLFDIDPKNLDKNNKRKKFKEEHYFIYPGIERYCPTILDNMMRLCQSQSRQFPKLLDRIRASNVEQCVTFQRGCDLRKESGSHLETSWRVSITGGDGIQLLSTEPLKPFADAKEVEGTQSMSLPDIFPVFPIVDLKKVNIYKIKNTTGFRPGFSHSHLHTLILPNTNHFSCEEMYSQMASQLFACLYARAVDVHGDVPMDLNDPIMGQCIASDGQNYQYLCMQLNTTKLGDDSGIKNMAWIDQPEVEEEEDFVLNRDERVIYSAHPMFSECSHRVWRSAEYYKDYDPKVFQTFLAFWMNGAT